MFKKISFLLATFFKIGYSPKAPGTCGSLAAIPLIVLCTYFFGFIGVAVLSVLLFVIGCVTCNEVLKYTEHDPSFIVIDELCGQAITFLSVAFVLNGDLSYNALWIYAAGFVLFRFFDITKPSFVGKIDKQMNNAFGVMLDDVVAGLFAAIVLWGLVGGVQMTVNHFSTPLETFVNATATVF